MYVFSYFPFGFENRIWDVIVSVPDHCLSFYFEDEVDSGHFLWLESLDESGGDYNLWLMFEM